MALPSDSHVAFIVNPPVPPPFWTLKFSKSEKGTTVSAPASVLYPVIFPVLSMTGVNPPRVSILLFI